MLTDEADLKEVEDSSRDEDQRHETHDHHMLISTVLDFIY